MITLLIQFLAVVLVMLVFFYGVKLAAQHFGAPAFVTQIVGLILLLILCLWLLNVVGGIRLPGP